MEKTEFVKAMEELEKEKGSKPTLEDFEDIFLSVYSPFMKDNNKALKGLKDDEIKALSSILNNPKYILNPATVSNEDYNSLKQSTNHIDTIYEMVSRRISESDVHLYVFHLGAVYNEFDKLKSIINNLKKKNK